jgi:hypothetical protein
MMQGYQIRSQGSRSAALIAPCARMVFVPPGVTLKTPDPKICERIIDIDTKSFASFGIGNI